MESAVQLEKEKEAEKVRRFDDVFRMLMIVMSITTSVGLSLYKIDLVPALAYFFLSLGFWMVAHLMGSNMLYRDLEIGLKITSWSFALLVTGSTLTKLYEKSTVLENYARVAIGVIVFLSTILLFRWFGEIIPLRKRWQYILLFFVIVSYFIIGSLGF